MAEAKQITKLKLLSARRHNLMEKVHRLDSEIHSIISEIQARPAVAKPAHPKVGSGPYKLCKVMSSRPKTKDEIAKRTGLSRGTVTLYLQQFGCFQSAGRGKGYVYNKPKDIKE
jgi:hypothetical protein